MKEFFAIEKIFNILLSILVALIFALQLTFTGDIVVLFFLFVFVLLVFYWLFFDN